MFVMSDISLIPSVLQQPSCLHFLTVFVLGQFYRAVDVGHHFPRGEVTALLVSCVAVVCFCLKTSCKWISRWDVSTQRFSEKKKKKFYGGLGLGAELWFRSLHA